ncbi:PAS fold-containing protein [Modestobacter sp. DSM 44400]|uniref:PAS and ANTAR domain-containing protein n=1 Tax=Modestobacter sp. DSM 44400 TaxID=1550230 RepID=UPI00089D7733|nr:PAS and ANTAR domain-containing protein [Modestobacter sp. DSM 44400]SDY16254.1 PAS fold-containing protein [Modestobacter sp. DSM 44400]
MSLTSTPPRTPRARRSPAPAPAPASSTEHIPVPPAARPAGDGPAGRYRYDLQADQWWWSPQFFALHGLTPGTAMPGVPLLLAGVHPADRPRVRQAVTDACTAGVPFAVEHRVVRSDGEIRTAVLVGELEISSDGEATALSGLVIDVTDGRAAAEPGDQIRALESEIEQLRTAMVSRVSIEQAKGVLMLLMGCADSVAFDLLTHISSHTHRKVRDVATAIVESAGGGTALPADVRAILHDACPPGAPAA